MPLLPASLQAAFAAGALVVTPNRRLARQLVAMHDASRRSEGRIAWRAAQALPWAAWLEQLWNDALTAGLTRNARLQPPLHGAHLWQRIVDAHAAPLLDVRGAAALAAEAWRLVHAWGNGSPSWRAWLDGGDDCAAFAQWAERYAATLARAATIDAAQLSEHIAASADRMRAWNGARVVIAGAIELAPQQRRMLAALEAAGAQIERSETLPDQRGRVRRAASRTPRDELALALSWARAHALADPQITIGIAIPDLATRRAEVRALAEEILCPPLQWPGREAAPRPYNISLGAALADEPPVVAALELIELAAHGLPLERAANLLRSPHLPDPGDAWMRRAKLERDWLEQGRRVLTMNEIVFALTDADPALAQRWRAASGASRQPRAATPRAWIEAWQAWLGAAGWPGDRPLDSREHQARLAWDDALAAFATLGDVEPRLGRDAALAALRSQLETRVFQPESPPVPIQILGPLEAAGLPFDALWVTDVAAESWPPPARPNPLLPIAWQRAHDVPRSSAARQLAFTRALTAQFARAASEVVFSHARCVDDHPRSASALVPEGTPLGADAIAVARDTARRQFDSAPPIEVVAIDRAPPLPSGARAPGGARLIEAQSDCPFKAVAACRLGVEPWPLPIDGLSARERGTLIHAALAALWRDLADQRGLLALDAVALAARVAAAVAAAPAALPAPRWRGLSPLIGAGEARRLTRVIEEWLEECERKRPPFRVREIEGPATLLLRGLSLRLRLDRVDELDGGGTAIIDYKSGRSPSPETWLDARPQAPQLALYALARRAMAPTQAVRAVAYAQLRPGEVKAQGLAADANAWPALKLPQGLRRAAVADWEAVSARWTESLEALAGEIGAGEAAVAPRGPETCRRCGRHAMCRIGAGGLGLANEGGDEE